MRALTLHAGWAWAICHLGKRIENRPWKIPKHRIGQRIAIHAGANVGDRPGKVATAEVLDSIALMAGRAAAPFTWPDASSIQTRAIVATAVLESCSMNRAHADGLAPSGQYGWAVPGQYGWVLADVRVLAEPVPVLRGALGLWYMDERVRKMVEVQTPPTKRRAAPVPASALAAIQALGSVKITTGPPTQALRMPTLAQRVAVQVDAACAEVKGKIYTEQERGEP